MNLRSIAVSKILKSIRSYPEKEFETIYHAITETLFSNPEDDTILLNCLLSLQQLIQSYWKCVRLFYFDKRNTSYLLLLLTVKRDNKPIQVVIYQILTFILRRDYFFGVQLIEKLQLLKVGAESNEGFPSPSVLSAFLDLLLPLVESHFCFNQLENLTIITEDGQSMLIVPYIGSFVEWAALGMNTSNIHDGNLYLILTGQIVSLMKESSKDSTLAIQMIEHGYDQLCHIVAYNLTSRAEVEENIRNNAVEAIVNISQYR